jgi:hypothetical protein
MKSKMLNQRIFAAATNSSNKMIKQAVHTIDQSIFNMMSMRWTLKSAIDQSIF